MREIKKTADELRRRLREYEGEPSNFSSPVRILKLLLASLISKDREEAAGLFKVTEEGARIYRGMGFWEPITESDITVLAGAFDGILRETIYRPKLKIEEPKYIQVDLKFRRELSAALLLDLDGQDETFFQESGYLGTCAFRDGVFALSDTTEAPEIYEHSPDFRCRTFFDTDILPHFDSPDAPVFEQAVKDWFIREGEEETARLRQILLEWIGVAALGQSTRMAKGLWCLGDGDNGKSVLLNAITGIRGRFKGIFPEGASASSCPTSWDLPGLIGMQSRQALAGAMVNSVGEVSGNSFKDTSAYKSILAGDRVNCREAFSAMASRAFNCAHIFGLNNLPEARKDGSDGFFRRSLFLPFRRNFSTHPTPIKWAPDKLSAAIANERGPILAMALKAGCEALRRGRYTASEVSGNLLTEFKRTNPFHEFIATLESGDLRNKKKDWVKQSTLWVEFKALQDESVHLPSDKLTKSQFVRQMKAKFPDHHVLYRNVWVFCVNHVIQDDTPRIGLVSSQRQEEFEVP